jgi:hypothetical protein
MEVLLNRKQTAKSQIMLDDAKELYAAAGAHSIATIKQ